MANNNQKNIYRTAQGKQIDLNRLINQNELTLAVGNKKVNARGDLIGAGGQIIKKHENSNGIVIPDQIRTRVQEEVVIENSVETELTVTGKPKTKNTKGMDPEGNE